MEKRRWRAAAAALHRGAITSATYSLPVGLVAGPGLVPLSGGLPAWVPRLLTPFEVSGCCVVPELED